MTRTHIVVGTRDELGGETLGAANVYHRAGLDGLSVLLVFDDRELIVAVGDEVEAGGRRHRLVAIEPYPATDGYALTFEMRAETPKPSPEGPSARDELILIDPLTLAALADRLRDATPGVLRALGHAVGAVEWRTTSRDSFTTEWNGGRTGPSTHTQHVARLTGAEASVRTSIVRWNPDEIARQSVNASWCAEESASCVADSMTPPFRDLRLSGPPRTLALLRTTLGEVPMDDGFLVDGVDTLGATQRPFAARLQSESAVDDFLTANAKRSWRAIRTVGRASDPNADRLPVSDWRSGSRP